MARTWDSFQLKLCILKLYSDLAFRGDLIQDGHEIHKIKVVLVSNLR